MTFVPLLRPVASSRAGWRGLARSRPVMKAALAHHLAAPVEPPANQHKSNGERRDAENHKQRHEGSITRNSSSPGTDSSPSLTARPSANFRYILSFVRFVSLASNRRSCIPQPKRVAAQRLNCPIWASPSRTLNRGTGADETSTGYAPFRSNNSRLVPGS